MTQTNQEGVKKNFEMQLDLNKKEEARIRERILKECNDLRRITSDYIEGRETSMTIDFMNATMRHILEYRERLSSCKAAQEVFEYCSENMKGA